MKALHPGMSTAERRGGPLARDPLAALLDDANAGNRDSLGRILAATAPAVLAVVRVILGSDNPDVPDVAQESLLAVKDALRSFRGEASLVQYARQIAVRTALAARRGRGARDRLIERFRRESAVLPTEDPGVDPVRCARAARRRSAGSSTSCPKSRPETFALRVVLDYSLDQVAAVTGAPVNPVRSRVRLAREKLKQKIEADPELWDVLRGEGMTTGEATIDLHPEDMLDAARRGTLGAAAAEDLHAHLDRCAACRLSLTLPDDLHAEAAVTSADDALSAKAS